METFRWPWLSNASAHFFRTIHSVLPRTFYRSNWTWKVNGRWQFWKNPTHQRIKMLPRESSSFSPIIFQIRQNSTIRNMVFNFPLQIMLTVWTLSFTKDTTTTKAVSQLKCLVEPKKLRFTLQMKDLVLHSLVETLDTFSEVMLAIFLEWRYGESEVTKQKVLATLSAYTLMESTHLIEYNIADDTKVFLSFQSSKREKLNYCTVRELSDI